MKFKFQGQELVLDFPKYPTWGNQAIVANLPDGEPWAVLSVNLEFIPQGCVAIPDYKLPRGIVEALQEAKIIGNLVREIPSGYVLIPVYEFLGGKDGQN
ncbi:MAG TPA: hypothetical protein PKD55_01335 [Bellilinea sp.]|nr:hypothetical protein [Bellilinea sp.]